MDHFKSYLSKLECAKNDSEKLALVMVISKAVKLVALSEAEKTSLFQAISSRFILKLLKANSIEKDKENENLYRKLGLSILSAFSSIPDLPMLVDPCLCEVVAVVNGYSVDGGPGGSEVYQDCLELLCTWSGIDCFSQAIREKLLISVLLRLLQDKKFSLIALTLIGHLMSDSLGFRYLQDLLGNLFATINSEKTLLSVQLFEVANQVLSHYLSITQIASVYKETGAHVSSKLVPGVCLSATEVLLSKVKAEFKMVVIEVISLYSMIFGYDWIFEASCHHLDSCGDFVVLILLNINVNINVVAKMGDEQVFSSSSLVHCCSIAEHIVQFMVEDKFDEHLLAKNSEFITKMFKLLTSFSEGISLYTAKVVPTCWKTNEELVLSCLSFLHVWILNETSMLDSMLTNLMPVLFKAAQLQINGIESGVEVNFPFVNMLASLSCLLLDIDSKNFQFLVRMHADEVISRCLILLLQKQEYLDSQLFCHLTRFLVTCFKVNASEGFKNSVLVELVSLFGATLVENNFSGVAFGGNQLLLASLLSYLAMACSKIMSESSQLAGSINWRSTLESLLSFMIPLLLERAQGGINDFVDGDWFSCMENVYLLCQSHPFSYGKQQDQNLKIESLLKSQTIPQLAKHHLEKLLILLDNPAHVN